MELYIKQNLSSLLLHIIRYVVYWFSKRKKTTSLIFSECGHVQNTHLLNLYMPSSVSETLL